ncbi:MAG TPA: bifunctional nuclease family protein [Acidimicrobiales bacterium]|nr:bifunctional nuclease family protein [Acidimicrobiales bacterium]
MELLGVRLELPANNPVVLLREQGGDRRVLPIYIGPEEAKAIALALEGVTPPRPMTHDLLRDVIEALGATVVSVTVTELRDSTFYAELELHLAGAVYRVSSRPSDAIALAVRVDAAIFASEEVLDDAAGPVASDEPEEQDQIIDEFREFIDQISPEDFES